MAFRSAGHVLVCYCTNLSRGGLFVCCENPPDVGERLRLKVQLPGESESAEIDAVVRWNRQSDDDTGPSGMGLAFADASDVLGPHVDRLVASFAPLRIAIVGNPAQAWHHISALVRSLVASKTEHHPLRATLAERVAKDDLVVVDASASPAEALAFVGALRAQAPHTPILALCPAQDYELRRTMRQHARVVPTPVDGAQLREHVLETLSTVHARAGQTPGTAK